MNTNIQALQALYVKLGGALTDTYAGIAGGIPVGEYSTLPDLIEAVSQISEDFSDLATKNDVTSATANLATQSYVTQQINNAGFATQDYVNTQIEAQLVTSYGQYDQDDGTISFNITYAFLMQHAHSQLILSLGATIVPLFVTLASRTGPNNDPIVLRAFFYDPVSGVQAFANAQGTINDNVVFIIEDANAE